MSFRLCLTHSVQEQHVHIVEPVAKQVLQFIIQKLGYLEFFRENGSIDMVSDFSGTSKAVDKNGNPEIHHNRVRAKLNWNLNPQTVKWQGNGTTIDLGNGNHLVTNSPVAHKLAFSPNTYSEGNAAVMSDVQAFTDLYEYSVGSTLSMEVQMDFKDDSYAFECLTRMFQCFQNGEMIGYVDVQYDYPIPNLLQCVYKHVSDLMGYDDYAYEMIRHSGGNIDIVQNRNNPDQRELVVKKNHFQAIYQIECSQEAPTPGDPDGATLNFTVTVQFARANRLMMKWPIIVNNKFVDFNYVPVDPKLRASSGRMPSPVMWRNDAVTKLWASTYPNRLNPVHYPWWDDWDLPTTSVQHMRGFTPIVIVAFCLDDAENPDGETVIDLVHGLPGIKLNDDIAAEILNSKGRELLYPNRYVNVAVFADDVQVGTPDQIEDNIKPVIEIDHGKLILRARRKYTQYRLVISINPKPVNLTAKPLACEVYPSRWTDVTAPSYINTKDSIVNTGKKYYFFNALAGEYVLIPTTEGEPISDVYARLAKIEDVYEQKSGVYVPTEDDTITRGKSYYLYDITNSDNPYTLTAFEVGAKLSNIKSQLSEAGCVYEYKDALYGQDITESEEPIIGYTVVTDTTAKYDTEYYIKDTETGELKKIDVEFDKEFPVGTTVYTKNKTSQKYYINKSELNTSLSTRMLSLASAMSVDDVPLPVYEEVDIPAGLSLEEVKAELGVDKLYTDNVNAAPKEPVYSTTTENEHYDDSYKPINISRVFQVTFYMKKRKPY